MTFARFFFSVAAILPQAIHARQRDLAAHAAPWPLPEVVDTISQPELRRRNQNHPRVSQVHHNYPDICDADISTRHRSARSAALSPSGTKVLYPISQLDVKLAANLRHNSTSTQSRRRMPCSLCDATTELFEPGRRRNVTAYVVPWPLSAFSLHGGPLYKLPQLDA